MDLRCEQTADRGRLIAEKKPGFPVRKINDRTRFSFGEIVEGAR